MARKKKYRYRATKTKDRRVGWLITTNKRLSDFKSITGAVKYIMRDDRNFKNIVNAIEEQNPGFFTDVEFNANLVDIKTDKQKATDFIVGRLKASQYINRKKGHDLGISELIENEFKTEAYLSREDRIKMNLNKMYSKRHPYYSEEKQKMTTGYLFTKERQFMKDNFGTVDFNKIDLKYANQLPYNMPLSPHSKNRGYYAYDNNGNLVFWEEIEEKIGDTEYQINLVIHYQENGKWVSMYNPDMRFEN